ncbi:MAG: hypothetical protein A2583_05465 [Bdellovibrionales bacterium RIFOXYD1_FULL_53_11]|nr:MAG: hypothetical protein A2583_05465 [Bdellovibrionales bacterium RIFOXYD1_FULL_53_11]
MEVSDNIGMKMLISVLCVGFVSCVTVFPVLAAEKAGNLPLVFDPVSKKYFIGGTSKFMLKQSEASALVERIEVSIDNAEYKSYAGAIEFKEEGKHSLKFRAVNSVNHWSPVQFVEVFADLTAPTTEAKFQDDKSYRDGAATFISLGSAITLVAQDNLSGISSIEYSWDGTSFSPYTKPVAVDKAGQQAFHFRSADRVGNIEASKRIDFVADGTAPASELRLNRQSAAGPGVSPTTINGKNFLSDSVAFSVAAQDDYSKVRQTWVVIDGKQQLYIRPVYFLQEGPHTFGYYSVDNTGNKEPLKSISIHTVSSTPRTAARTASRVVNMGGINYARSDFQLLIDSQPNVAGIEKVEYKVDQEADYKPYIEAVRFSAPGLHTVSYRSIDRVGNAEPAKSYNVFITDTAPETALSTAQPLIVRDGVTYSPSPNVVTLNVGKTPVGVKNILVSVNDGAFQPYTAPITLNSNQKVMKIAYKSVDRLDNEEHPRVATFNMIGSSPVVDLFVSSGQSREETVRTNYLENDGPNRGVAGAAGK